MSNKIVIDLDENQYAINQTVVSDTVSTEHGIGVQDLTKLDTKFAEAKKESDGLTETITNLLTTVSSLTEANRSLTQENTQLEYHQRRNNLVFDGNPEEKGETD